MTQTSKLRSRSTLSWMLYDAANSVFVTSIMVAFYPVFFAEYWRQGIDAVDTTSKLGISNALASFIVVLLAPILGALADNRGNRKTLLLGFIFTSCAATTMLVFVPQDNWFLAAALFVILSFAYQISNVFYDSMLVFVSNKDNIDKISALAYGGGYLCGGVILLLNVLMVTHYQWFFLNDSTQAVKAVFIFACIWWLLLTIPLWIYVKERPGSTQCHVLQSIYGAVKELQTTFLRIKILKETFKFLLAYFIYIDGVYTIMRMGINYGISLNIDSSAMITALALTNFIGVPAAILFGYLGQRYRAKTMILFGLFGYTCIAFYSPFMETQTDFFIMAGALGCFQGGVQSLSRSLYASIVPVKNTSEFFGFFDMIGKLSAVIGPLLLTAATVFFNNVRAGVIALSFLFIVGSILLIFVDAETARDVAQSEDFTKSP